MTYEEREKIFSKEVLSIKDIMQLFDICQSEASVLLSTMRRWAEANNSLRVNIKGKIHIQDYLDYFKLSPVGRYDRLTID